ncbi:sigma factor-like helix-turn-helix DNA-binding protein [Ferrimonas pelagia]|uniref:RNA polymerase sigma-70 region 4 domain-containing protein n=1 Tax=Ferrimonas pelagia TaxID=1177826 RepID=A0ABP9FNF8_9GAMM
MMKLNEKTGSLNIAIGGEGDKQLVDFVEDERSAGPSEQAQSSGLHQSLSRWLDTLPDKQCEILARRFGLRGHEPTTLEVIGKDIGLTRERVRQLQVQALATLRNRVAAEGLDLSDLLS